jgi:hypothetical protein
MAMLATPFFVAPVVAVVIVGLGAAGDGEEDETSADGGADEMAETHWAIPPKTSEGTQPGYRFIPKNIAASSRNSTTGFRHIPDSGHKKSSALRYASCRGSLHPRQWNDEGQPPADRVGMVLRHVAIVPVMMVAMVPERKPARGISQPAIAMFRRRPCAG